jgi:uncharacterized protein (UPF0147 family)
MIDNEKLQSLKVEARVNETATLGEMTRDQLLELKELLDQRLPTMSLSELNLEHELLLQYERVKQLQQDVLNDDSVPANQRAQVANSVASTLQHLIKMQTEYSTAERFKAIEALMIKAMKRLPIEVATEFLAEYERIEA